jgi:phage terminase Nu1 subunit (DNA packaging protein)
MSSSTNSLLTEYVTKDELAEALGRSTRTLDRWADLRIGPPRTRAGRRVLYNRVRVTEWLDSHTEEMPRDGLGRERRSDG